jgi:hypothetical protein
MKSYFPLIEFNINHDFFEGGKCNDIDIVIAQNETRLKNNYNFFLHKHKPWHYIFYIEKNENFLERSGFLEGDIREDNHLIEFLLIARNRNFFSYTENVDSLAGGNLADIQVDLNVENSESLLIDFKKDPVLCTDSLLNKFIVKAYPAALACVTLNISTDKGNIIYNRVKNLQTLKVFFSFESKSAYWQYILIPRIEKEVNLQVNETNRQVQFSEIKWDKLENNQKVGFSSSNNAIKLSEKYPFIIQLWEKFQNGQSLLINRLAFPDPSNPANYSHDEQMRNLISIYQYF